MQEKKTPFWLSSIYVRFRSLLGALSDKKTQSGGTKTKTNLF